MLEYQRYGTIAFPIEGALCTLQEYVIRVSIPAIEVCNVDKLFVFNADYMIKVIKH